MPLVDLDHYFVRVRDLERSRRFYCDVLGLEVMPRPNFPFPGYWLGVGGKVQVHMGADGIPAQDAIYLGTRPHSARDNAGVVDHVAFRATDPQATLERLRAAGFEVRARHFPEIQLFQLFIADPDGLMIELNFPGVAAAPVST
jgi:catechol 2,3-dioxygenase-like lactoylglutathione lyase family enzyme